MQNTVVTRGGLNIPDTFEVYGRDGWVLATYTREFFKDAEAHVDRLNAEDPEGGYTWRQVTAGTDLLAWHLSRNDNHDWSFDLEYAPARFWNEWNHPLKADDWCRVELDRNGNPYTVKWSSMSYQSNGAGRVTTTTFLVADGYHASTTETPTTLAA